MRRMKFTERKVKERNRSTRQGSKFTHKRQILPVASLCDKETSEMMIFPMEKGNELLESAGFFIAVIRSPT